MFSRAVFVFSFLIYVSAQRELSSGNVESTARLNVIFPQLELRNDNNVPRRQLQAPMVEPSGLQPQQTNSLRLLQLQMEILRMQDLVRRQLAENGQAEPVIRQLSTTTTTTAAPTTNSEVEDNATRLGRLLESLSGSSSTKTGDTFNIDGIQGEIESLQQQLGRISASRARASTESKPKPVVNNNQVRVLKKTPRLSYFDMPAEPSKVHSNIRSFRSRDIDGFDDEPNDKSRAALPGPLFGLTGLGINQPDSLESQLTKYQKTLSKYMNPKYTSMLYEPSYIRNSYNKKYKPDHEYEEKYNTHPEHSHGHNHESYDEDKYEHGHKHEYDQEFTLNYSNPITGLTKPGEVNVGGVAQNAILELVLEILKLAAGGDGRGIFGAIVKLPALIVRGLLKTMVSALAKDGLRGLIIKFLIPLIALLAVNVVIIFLAWWLWEDGHCDMEIKEPQKTYYD